MKKILECSSKGDKRFSAFYANLYIFNQIGTIEEFYQKCKRTYKNNTLIHISGKGVEPDFIMVNGIKLEPTYLTQYYKFLWVTYLDNNQDLVEYAKQFDNFSDMFKGKSINCQADVIREYIKKGRNSIVDSKEYKEFLNKIGININ